MQLKDRIVRIFDGCGESIGTGLLLNGFVCTVDHILEDCNEVLVSYNGCNVKASIAYRGKEEQVDIAFLGVEIFTEFQPDFSLDEHMDESTNIIGYPKMHPHFPEGRRISAKIVNYNFIDALPDYHYKGNYIGVVSVEHISKGFSGAPVLLDNVLIGFVASEQLGERAGYITNVISIKSIINADSGRFFSLFGRRIEHIPFVARISEGIGENPFLYDANTVEFFGRRRELKELVDFCIQRREITDNNGKVIGYEDIGYVWWALVGAGGMGKTRLAYELCKAINILDNWEVFAPRSYDYDELRGYCKQIKCNTLIILDYVQWYAKEIGKWMEWLLNLRYTYNIRILLIERETETSHVSSWDKLLFYEVNSIHSLEQTKYAKRYLYLGCLEKNDLRRIMISFAAQYGDELSDTDAEMILSVHAKVDKMLVRPLYLLFIVAAKLEGHDLINWDRDKALNYVLHREMHRIRRNIISRIGDVSNPERIFGACRKMILMSTLMGGLSVKKRSHMCLLHEYEYLCGIASKHNYSEVGDFLVDVELANKNGLIRPLEPDLVGEFFIIDYLHEIPISEGRKIITLAWNAKREMKATTSRVLQDYSDLLDEYCIRELFTNIALPSSFNRVSKGDMDSTITYIKIPDGTTEIADNAFEGFSFLRKVVLPRTLTKIGKGSFRGCEALEEISLPEELTLIDDYAFWGCSNLKDIEFPKQLISIGKQAFMFCNRLRRVDIPPNVVDIRDGAFSNCGNVCSLHFASPCKIDKISNNFCSYAINLQKINIPESIRAIGAHAFQHCGCLEHIDFPQSVVNIGYGAFAYCTNLKYVRLGKGNISVDSFAFNNCINLSIIDSFDSIVEIGNYAFNRCIMLASVHLGSLVRYIGIAPFAYCSRLESIDIDRGTDFYSVDGVLFSSVSNCLLQYPSGKCSVRFSIQENVVEIGPFAFAGNESLEEVEVQENVKVIGESSFQGCIRLKSVTIPISVSALADKTFCNCTDLEEINLSESIQQIGNGVFWRCKNLKSIRITKAMIKIDNCTFWGCTAISDIYVMCTDIVIDEDSFIDCKAIIHVHVDIYEYIKSICPISCEVRHDIILVTLHFSNGSLKSFYQLAGQKIDEMVAIGTQGVFFTDKFKSKFWDFADAIAPAFDLDLYEEAVF